MFTSKTRPCVLALTAEPDKAGLKTLAFQVAQLTTACVHKDLEVIDVVVVIRGGTKEILKELRRLDKRQSFDCVVVYSPNQICKNAAEYGAFKAELENEFGVPIMPFRIPT